MYNFTERDSQRLQEEKNIWLASVNTKGNPHLVPLWFISRSNKIYMCTQSSSVKIRNLRNNNKVALSLENGHQAFICEGETKLLYKPFPKDVVSAFKAKYDWNIQESRSYDTLIEVFPQKVLKFNDDK